MKNIIYDAEAYSDTTANPIGAYPWLRFDAELFIREEAFLNGSYLWANHSSMGRCFARANVHQRLHGRYQRGHLAAFQLEVNGGLLYDGWEFVSQGGEDNAHEVTLRHTHIPVEVVLHTSLDGSSFVERSMTVKNTGGAPLALTGVYPFAGILFCENTGQGLSAESLRPDFELGSFVDAHVFNEGRFAWQTLPKGTLCLGNQYSAYNPQAFYVKNTATGEIFVVKSEFTMHWAAEFTRLGDYLSIRPYGHFEDYVHMRIGIDAKHGITFLAPGESIRTPAVHFSCLVGSLDTCVNKLFEHLRSSVLPAQKGELMHPISYNHTGYTQNAQITRELLMEEVEVAASAGIDIFLVDAGWFGDEKRTWPEVIGDWYENPVLEKSGGMKSVFEYAKSLGLKCGLWLPIEIIGLTSETAKLHPDWILTKDGAPIGVLDITKPEVEEHMYNTVTGAIEKYGLDCWRIDGGLPVSPTSQNGGLTESHMWRYYNRLYAFFERIQKRYPGLYMENCSGGGGRPDLGMMRRFHWTQVSDDWTPLHQLKILNGMTLALPPEQCMCLVGAINMKGSELDFLTRTGMMGHFCASGVFPYVKKSNEAGLKRWQHATALYKEKIRPIIGECSVYHHTPEQNQIEFGEWVVLEYVSKDKNNAVAAIFRLPGAKEGTYRFVARGLSAAKDYRVTFDNSGEGVVIPGYILSGEGLPVRVDAAMASELLVLEAVL